MPTLSLSRLYDSGQILLAADLDAFLDDLETFVNTTGLDDDNIQNGGITASTKFVAGSITKAKMGTASIGATQIADDAVTVDKIAEGCAGLGLAQNVDGSLELSYNTDIFEISGDALRIKDDGIDVDQLGALTLSNSSTVSTQAITGTLTTVSGLSVALTTTGRPVWLIVQATSATANDIISQAETGNTVISVRLFRDSTVLDDVTVGSYCDTDEAYLACPGSSTLYIDTPSAGSYTYTIKVIATTTGSSTQFVNDFTLYAIEV